MTSYDDDEDDDRDDRDDWEEIRGRIDEENERWKCVLGERCLVADPFHSSDECFDAEWADAYFAEQNDAAPADGQDQTEVHESPEDDILLS